MTLEPGWTVTQALPSVTTVNARMSATVDIAARPSAGYGVSVTSRLRSTGSGNYQATFRYDGDGRLTAQLRRFNGTQATVLAHERYALQSVSPGTPVQIEFEVAGTDPVELRARAYAAGGTAPAWQLQATDASASRLRSGHVGLQGYLSSASTANQVKVSHLAVHSLTQEAPAPAPPAPPTPPTPPTPPAPEVGSLPVGTASYPLPADAVYVAPLGNAGGNGSVNSPYGSLAHAVSQARSGATLVLRGGTYHEFVNVPFNKALTIQNYPAEAVWLDGSRVVTGWQQDGNRWFVPNWNYDFDSRVSFTRGVDESHRYVHPDYPMAGHPDQTWINGHPLRQVGSRSAVAPGTFFVDKGARRLYIGDDPAGKQVRSSTIQRGLQIQGSGTTVRGIGVRRYANHLALMGAVTTEVDNIRLENMVVSENATVGINGWNRNHTFDRLTVTGNGIMGIGHNAATNLSITRSVIAGNNREHFNSAPSSGGIKVTRSTGVTVKDSVLQDNVNSAGVWLDQDTYDITITGNRIHGNGSTGIMFEESGRGVIANNYIVGQRVGLWIYSSGAVKVWNNTMLDNARTFALWQDQRSQKGNLAKDVDFHNNLVSYGDNFCPMLLQDLREQWRFGDFDFASDGNYYRRPSRSNPERFYCVPDDPRGTKSFTTFDAFRSATGQESRGRVSEGPALVNGSWQPTQFVRDAEPQVALALPSSVAALVGQPAGTRRLGALTTPLPPPR